MHCLGTVLRVFDMAYWSAFECLCLMANTFDGFKVVISVVIFFFLDARVCVCIFRGIQNRPARTDRLIYAYIRLYLRLGNKSNRDMMISQRNTSQYVRIRFNRRVATAARERAHGVGNSITTVGSGTATPLSALW